MRLREAEWRIMKALWRCQPARVRDLIGQLADAGRKSGPSAIVFSRDLVAATGSGNKDANKYETRDRTA